MLLSLPDVLYTKVNPKKSKFCSFNPSLGSRAAPHLQVPPELPSRPPISHKPFINHAGLPAGLWAALSCSGILHLEVSGAHPGTSPR